VEDQELVQDQPVERENLALVHHQEIYLRYKQRIELLAAVEVHLNAESHQVVEYEECLLAPPALDLGIVIEETNRVVQILRDDDNIRGNEQGLLIVVCIALFVDHLVDLDKHAVEDELYMLEDLENKEEDQPNDLVERWNSGGVRLQLGDQLKGDHVVEGT